jgi:serine protease inhibitor
MVRVLVIAATCLLFACIAVAPDRRGPRVGPSPDEAALAAASNAFAFDLYAKLCEGDGNLLFSPFSIYCGLAWNRWECRARLSRAARISRA